MKKVFELIISVIICLTFIGCSSNGNTPDNSSNTSVNSGAETNSQNSSDNKTDNPATREPKVLQSVWGVRLGNL